MSAQTNVLFDLPGPKARSRHRLFAVVGAVVLLAILAWVLMRMADKGQLDPDKWLRVVSWDAWRYYFLPGLRSTLVAAALAIIISMGLALGLAMARMSDNVVLRWAATLFVEFFHGVPVLIMMLFAFYFLVMMGWFPNDVNPLIGTVTGLVAYNSSVLAEVIRNGVASLPAGQREAGLSIGLSPSQTRRMILVPQSLTAMMPSLVSQVIVITKDSALGYMILYPELVTSARRLGSWAGAPFQAYVIAAVIFIVVNYGIDRFARWVETLQRRRGRSAGPIADAEDVPIVGAGVRGTVNAPAGG